MVAHFPTEGDDEDPQENPYLVIDPSTYCCFDFVLMM